MTPSISKCISKFAALVLLSLLPMLAPAQDQDPDQGLRIAVAANFARTMTSIASAYEQQTGNSISLISGSTGKHYAQIVNGAPFDLFFAADAERPALLEKSGLAVAGSRHTYAYGQLVLWSPDSTMIDPDLTVLHEDAFRYLAIANPRLAPYGRAAKETLQNQQLWDSVQGKLVRGENIAQTFQFVYSGNAQLGFVARSQLKAADGTNDIALSQGSFWLVPAELHQPIEQQSVILRPSAAADEFMAFMQSAQARQIILDHGYALPDDSSAHP
jgi:molybdate transport system substrate-binding protein